MRFDKEIGLIILTTIEDGLGGRSEGDKLVRMANANITELGLEETVRIYGEAYSDNLKVAILGYLDFKLDRIIYDGKRYKVVNPRKVKNKTCFVAEVLTDED